ncbi:MAG TPA: enoyl-CoA hydratase [Saprospiraceae bacterium]|nr:enoyl-CoA hydratase [Saprospiraceae bacterium]
MENVLLEVNNHIAQLTIHRPKALNALNKQTIAELSESLDPLAENPKVRVLIITGSGEKAFVAGADIKEFAGFDVKEGAQLAAAGHEMLFDKIENFPKPVIAAVNGFALGGGLELAMACHFRIASDNARLGLPETSLGLIPGYGGTQRLPQLVGKGKAIEMITTASMITAQDAYKWGLVNQVVAPAELADTCQKIAQKIAFNSPMAVSAALRAISGGFNDKVNGYNIEISEFGKCFGTDDFKEGTIAFLEKRKPNF